MEVYLGRQPIFTKEQKTYGYELLFRSGKTNAYDGRDAVESTSHVLTTAFSTFSIDEVVGGKKAFVNFPQRLLIEDIPKLYPKEILVVEVLEDVEPTQEVIDALKELKEEGYIIALDDFVYEKKFIPLIELADIIKVDFFITKGESRGIVIDDLFSINPHLLFLAEKVETLEEFEEAKKFGYKYFQGYFFTKPVIISTRDVPSYKLTYMRLLKEIRQPNLDFNKMEEILKTDVSLSYKLLKYINSVHFGLKSEIKSLRQAFVLLGAKGIKKWLTMVIVTNLSGDKPEELAALSVLRGRFCELIARVIGEEERAEEFFVTGLFSLIDTMLGRPKRELLDELSLASEVKDALLGRPNIFKDVLDLSIFWEEEDKEGIDCCIEKIGLDKNLVNDIYLEALKWSSDIFLS